MQHHHDHHVDMHDDIMMTSMLMTWRVFIVMMWMQQAESEEVARLKATIKKLLAGQQVDAADIADATNADAEPPADAAAADGGGGGGGDGDGGGGADTIDG